MNGGLEGCPSDKSRWMWPFWLKLGSNSSGPSMPCRLRRASCCRHAPERTRPPRHSRRIVAAEYRESLAITCSGATPQYFTPLRATCACLEVAAVGRPPRLAFPQSGGRAGRRGRWTRSALCPVQLGGPATRACSPHTGPKPARSVTLTAGGKAAVREF